MSSVYPRYVLSNAIQYIVKMQSQNCTVHTVANNLFAKLSLPKHTLHYYVKTKQHTTSYTKMLFRDQVAKPFLNMGPNLKFTHTHDLELQSEAAHKIKYMTTTLKNVFTCL